MDSFKEYILTERYVNLLPRHQAEKEKHAEHVFNLVQNAYKPIGGIKGNGFRDPADMVKNVPMWKLHKDSEGKVRAVKLYKDKGGRKGVAAASDGSEEGKRALANMMRDEVKQKRSYSEISDRALSFLKKQHGDIASHALPHHEVRRLMPDEEIRKVPNPHEDPDVQRHPELKDHFYQRKIGGEWKTKVAIGTAGNKITESRNLGTHSFGQEPPVQDYIKGLNSASERNQKEANAVMSRNKGMKGSFAKPENRYGMTQHHGTGDYEGYHLSHYSSSRDRSGNVKNLNLKDAVSHVNQRRETNGVNLWHGDTHVGNIRGSGDQVSAAHSYEFSPHHPTSHDTAAKFNTHQLATKYLIAKHKEHLASQK